MQSKNRDNESSWLILFLFCCITFAIAAQLNEYILDWEEYFRLHLSAKPLPEYLAGGIWRVSILLPEWVSFRLFGAQPEAWRLFSGLAALVSAFLALRISSRCFRSGLLGAIALAVLGLNAHFLDYARWALFTYSASIAYSGLFLCLFLRIHTGTSTSWTRLAALLVAAAGPIVSLRASILLIIVGPAAVFVSHFLCLPEGRPSLRGKLKDMLFFLAMAPAGLYVISPILRRVLDPLSGDHGTPRPDLYRRELYFWFSGVPHSVFACLKFYYDKTLDLLYWCVHPVGPGVGLIAWGLFLLLVLGLLGTLLRRRTEPDHVYVAVFLLVGLLVLISLNFLSLYPYGHVRYASFMLFPVSILCAHGAREMLRWMPRAWRPETSRAATRILSVALCIVVLYALGQEAGRRLATGRRAIQLISMMNVDADCVLVESRYRNIFSMNRTVHAKRTFFVDGPAGGVALAPLRPELIEDLTQGDHKTLLAVWWKPWFGHDEIKKLITSNYVEVDSVALQADPNYKPYNSRFHKYNLCATVFARRDLYDERQRSGLPTRIGLSTVARNEENGTITVKGWVLSPKPITSVDIVLDSERFQAAYPLQRPDVLRNFPEYGTELCGYEAVVPATQDTLASNLQIVVLSNKGEIKKRGFGKLEARLK